MSDTKFTKGDWVIKETAPLACAWTFDFEKMNLGFSIEKDEFDANTSLIAAAPEMYEMLQSARNEIYQLIDEVNDQRASRITSMTEDEPDYHDQETVYLIDKLLAKARGES